MEETKMVLLDHQQYLRLKNDYMQRKESNACSCSKTGKNIESKPKNSSTQEGYGDIAVVGVLPDKYEDKATIYDGAKESDLIKEQGGTPVSEETVNHADNSDKKMEDSPWYYIGDHL